MNTLKIQILAVAFIVTAIVAFVFGRRSVDKSTLKAKTKIITVTKIVNHKVTTIDKKPTGETITTIVDNSTDTSVGKDTNNVSESIVNPPKYNLSAMVGESRFAGPVGYGVSVSKQVAGPFTIGLFGFEDANIGVVAGATIGVNF